MIRTLSGRNLIILNVTGLVGVTGCIIAALFWGTEVVGFRQLLQVIDGSSPSEVTDILFAFRLPRIVLSFIVGASLSLAGLIFQTILRNPLADPYLLGISSGASFGSLLGRLFSGSSFIIFSWWIYMGSFLGAILTLLLVLAIGYSFRSLRVQTLVLAGVIVGAFLSACMFLVTSLLKENEVATQFLWLMGNIPILDWSVLSLFSVVLVSFWCFFFYLSKILNLMLLGEAVVKSSGLNAERLKILLIVHGTLLTALVVSVCGPIGFVGLVIPHFFRIVLGSDHRVLVSSVFWGGGAFLIISDLLARSVLSPTELPIGVVTSLIGAPYFLFLLKRKEIR